MVLQSMMNQGPTVEVTFATAEGLKAGETRVKRLAVNLGVVEEVYLNEGYGNVTAVLQLDPGTEDLLREDSQFWVVRPRLGSAGVSGLSTLLSGAYVELSPGSQGTGTRSYLGLENIPVTPQSTPGVHLEIHSARAVSLSTGSPVMYNGYRVGRVESVALAPENGETHYRIFVEAPYDDLVTSTTRFWNASGIDFDASASGVSVHMASVESLLAGGIAFGLPEESSAGTPVESDQVFRLYPNRAAIDQQPYRFGREFLLLFDTSVRGLLAGAPVEYRGIRLGSVLDVSFDLVAESEGWTADGHALMPVLIRIDPGRFGEDTQGGLTDVDTLISNGIQNGLRASLASGNLLTGARFVSLDFYEPDPNVEITEVAGLRVLPTVATGLESISLQVSHLLDKIQALPLQQTVASAGTALDALTGAVTTADSALAGVDAALADPGTRAVPGDLHVALRNFNDVLEGVTPESPLYADLQVAVLELRRTLQSARGMASTLDAKPNAVIFGRTVKDDPIPETR